MQLIKLVVALYCMSFALPVCGQGRDTLLAIHKLFKERRRSANAWTAAGLQTVYEESVGWRAIRPVSENVTSATVYGGTPLVIGILQGQRFSAEREAAIISYYQQGGGVPVDIRRRLRRRHFHRTARDM
jgi:hypothetical protein